MSGQPIPPSLSDFWGDFDVFFFSTIFNFAIIDGLASEIDQREQELKELSLFFLKETHDYSYCLFRSKWKGRSSTCRNTCGSISINRYVQMYFLHVSDTNFEIDIGLQLSKQNKAMVRDFLLFSFIHDDNSSY